MRCRLAVLTLSLLVAITLTGCGGSTSVKTEFAGPTITPGAGVPNAGGTGAPPSNPTPPGSPTPPAPPPSPTPPPQPAPPPSPTGVVVTTPNDGATVTSPLQV